MNIIEIALGVFFGSVASTAFISGTFYLIRKVSILRQTRENEATFDDLIGKLKEAKSAQDVDVH